MHENAPSDRASAASQAPPRRYWPLWQMVVARLREFYREPEAVFWVYGFPILMVVALGIAFRNKPVDKFSVDVAEGPMAKAMAEALSAREQFEVSIQSPEASRRRLRTGKTDLAISATPGETPADEAAAPWANGHLVYSFDPTRHESLIARSAVDDALQRAAGRRDSATNDNQEINESGGRYIDFLVPGLLGMSLMGGGLWGIGFVTVDMRIRKLLKRFLATPMKKSEFLAGIMISRLLFMVPEVLALLVFSRIAFGVENHGSVTAVVLLVLLGALSFAGIGLLVASRAKTIEAVSGLMNLVMLPMWILSGIFFSSDRFPQAVQPVIKILPLTLLIDTLRAVMLEGAPLSSQLGALVGMALWGSISFALALRWFRWI